MAEILYQGHGSFRLTTSEGSVIYIDPYAGEGYDRPADLVLVSHEHHDHNAVELVKRKEDGKILRSCEARVIRDKTPVFDGKMSTLRRFQDEVEEVKAGLECGIRLGDFNEYETGDIIECYTL